MDLKELNNRYEEIIQSNRPEEIKINQLSMLMMYMVYTKRFQIVA